MTNKAKVSIVNYDQLTKEDQEGVPDNGSGKEYANYIVIEDKDGRRVYSDAMEPEDATFNRDLSWITTELMKS